MHSILLSTNASPANGGLHLGRRARAVLSAFVRQCDLVLTVRHPTSGMRFRLRGLTHLRYWFMLTGRQRRLLRRLAGLTQPTDTAFDVGGGIGFTAQALAQKVGGDGQVHVFEPCPDKQVLLRQNIHSFANATLINAAVSNRIGKTPITTTAAKDTPRHAHTVTLDGYTTQHGLIPAVVRIGTGDHALEVLQGGRKTLARARAIVVNVSQDQDMIFGLLETAGYDLSDENGAPLSSPAEMTGPVFGTR